MANATLLANFAPTFAALGGWLLIGLGMRILFVLGMARALAGTTLMVSQSLIAYALAHLPAAFSAVSLLVRPMMAAVFAWMLLSESVGSGSVQAIGGSLMLAGIYLARQASLSTQ